MLKYLFLYFILLIEVYSDDFNTTILDKYHNDLCQILIDSSNSVDDYFIDTNSTKSSRTEAKLKSSFAVESSKKSEYALRLRLRINLPKIQKKLRLIFEDEDSDDTLYDGTALNNRYRVEDKNYFLRLDYFNYIIKKTKIVSGVGIKFKGLQLYPYLNLKAKYMWQESNMVTTNLFRLYNHGVFENTLTLNRLEYLNSSTYFLVRNFFKYRSSTNNTDIVNSISITKLFRDAQRLTSGLSLTSKLYRIKSYVKYPQIYLSYRDLLYKDWVYYEITPSILWREENRYDESYRFMFNIGVDFKTY